MVVIYFKVFAEAKDNAGRKSSLEKANTLIPIIWQMH